MDKQYRGYGYGTEIARAVIHFGIKYCNLPEISGSNRVTNKAPSRVMQKAGMLFKNQILQDDVDTVYYDISKSRWLPDGSLEFNLSA